MLAVTLEKRRILERKEWIINSRVFVGNLSFDTTESGLEALFSELGHVAEVSIPTDRNTGRPRGFAFVEFTDESAAAQAIEKFDGHELDGRNIRVSEAQERRSRPQWVPDGGQAFGQGRRHTPKPKGSRRGIRGRKRSL